MDGWDNGTAYTRLVELLRELGESAQFDQVGVALFIDEAQVLPSAHMDILFRAVNRLDELPIVLILSALPNIMNVIARGQRSSPHVFFQT
jgi:hypothetical protein